MTCSLGVIYTSSGIHLRPVRVDEVDGRVLYASKGIRGPILITIRKPLMLIRMRFADRDVCTANESTGNGLETSF